MSDFNSSELNLSIANLKKQSDELLERSKQLSKDFGNSGKDLAMLHKHSNELILQARQLIEKTASIKDENF